MKNLLIIILFSWLLFPNAYNQFTCEIIPNGLKSDGPIPDYLDYIPGVNTPIKYIRLNFHFMLLEDTHPDSPGNFTIRRLPLALGSGFQNSIVLGF